MNGLAFESQYVLAPKEDGDEELFKSWFLSRV